MQAKVSIVSLLLLLSPIIVYAHEVADPIIEIHDKRISVSQLAVQLVPLNIQLVMAKGLGQDTLIRIDQERVELSLLLGHSRNNFNLCAYLSTHFSRSVPSHLKLQPCAQKNKMCTSGLASPYPGPQIVEVGGEKRWPKIGAFLCGGNEYASMISEKRTHYAKQG